MDFRERIAHLEGNSEPHCGRWPHTSSVQGVIACSMEAVLPSAAN